MSTSETRPVLTGVNWLIQDNELICTATDSHRLAVRKLQLEDESENKNVIIPGKALSELNKIMSDSDEDIDIFFASNQVLFRWGILISSHVYLKVIIQIRHVYSQKIMRLN